MAESSPSNASISRRDFFYPLPYPLPPNTPIPYAINLPARNPLRLLEKPLEPTHTLVLTSTRKQFVDVRIFKRLRVEEPELPNEGGPRERLDWAFAGSASSVPIPDPFPYGVSSPTMALPPRVWPAQITQATWTHWLDSRHPLRAHLSPSHYEASVPPDTGTMFPHNAIQTLEFGSGRNPRTGEMWSYEEFWTDLAIEGTPLKWSVVLRLDAPEHAVRGVVIRLGRFCQGVVMKAGYVSVERWEWEEAKGCEVEEEGKKEGDGGSWRRTVKIGDQFLPCATTFRPEMLKEGGTVKYGDYLWVCEEKVAWREAEAEVEEVEKGHGH